MDDATFDGLVRLNMRAVTAYSRAIARDQWAAEEAVQETFLRAWKYIDSFRGTGTFEGWLLKICRHCVIDQAGRAAQLESLNDDKVTQLFAADREGYVVAADLVRRLPLPQREALVLCTVLGYDYEEAAALLDVPVGTIRSRVSRARATLDALLAESEEKLG